MSWDWNIITQRDVGGGAAIAYTEDGTVVASDADGYAKRLAKYVPLPVAGVYTFVENILVDPKRLEIAGGLLLGLLVTFALLAFLYAWRVLRVRRKVQLAMTVLAFIVYVASIGGWFKTLSIWQPGYGSVAVAVYALLVQIIMPGALPPPSSAAEPPVSAVEVGS